MVRTTTMVKEIIAMNALVYRRTPESRLNISLYLLLSLLKIYIKQITNEPTSTSIETPIRK